MLYIDLSTFDIEKENKWNDYYYEQIKNRKKLYPDMSLDELVEMLYKQKEEYIKCLS